MRSKCSSCGAGIDGNMRICPNCGRLLASIGDRHEYQAPRTSRSPEGRTSRAGAHTTGAVQKNTGRPPRTAQDKPARRKPAERPVREAVKKQPSQRVHTKPKAHPPARQEEKELPRWTRIIKRVTLIAVILAAVYFALFGLQVLRIKHSSYEFDTKMKLSAENYGEAFSNSVTDGSWSYNPFTFGMTYSGIHDGKELEIKFSAGWSLEVKCVRVGKEDKTSKEQINIYLMGLFI